MQPNGNGDIFKSGYGKYESNIDSLRFYTDGRRKAHVSNIDQVYNLKKNETINFSQATDRNNFLNKMKTKKSKLKHLKSRNGCNNCKD